MKDPRLKNFTEKRELMKGLIKAFNLDANQIQIKKQEPLTAPPVAAPKSKKQ